MKTANVLPGSDWGKRLSRREKASHRVGRCGWAFCYIVRGLIFRLDCRPQRFRRFYYFMMSGVPLLSGCQARPTRPSAVAQYHRVVFNVKNDALRLNLSQHERSEHIIQGWRLRLLRRYVSWDELDRVSREIRPIVDAAAHQPALQPLFLRIARDQNLSLDQSRSLWSRLQEADLLLEAGGDVDAVSSAMACGAAQWLASTAQGQGLHVDVNRSRALTQQIQEMDRRIAWLRYLILPDADRSREGAPALSPSDAARMLPELLTSRDRLAALRRKIDDRFDARRAIFAQTRYLLLLYARFPCWDWLFQAYHGGEGGVVRILRRYCDPERWTPRLIRQRSERDRLSFEHVFLTTSPLCHPGVFAYLYGRSDDDRHYWWKLLASMQELAEFRSSPERMKKRWTGLMPGRRLEALWYPQGPEAMLPDLETVARAIHDGDLIPVRDTSAWRVREQPLDVPHREEYSALRAPAWGALRMTIAAFHQCGGSVPLTLGDLILTGVLADRQLAVEQARPRKARPWPPDYRVRLRPGGGPPATFNYHTTGLVFDLLPPSDHLMRERLEYALDYLQEREIVAVTLARDNGELRYHVCPSPRFGKVLAEIGSNGPLPALPGL